MSDHCEEQEMEAEALEAIFAEAFRVIHGEQPFQWCVKLLPVDCAGDPEAEEEQNYVGINLIATIPVNYPEESLPKLDIEILKGLSDEHKATLLDIATKEAKNNEGMPAIYAICEVLRDWLADNNIKGLDDASMHAQMMRRAKEEEVKKERAEREFESQKKEELLSAAETEDLAVRKRRAEGTPCTKENFEAWRERFEQEMLEKAAADAEADADQGGKKTREKKVDKSDRITGYLQFVGKVGKDVEDMEKAAEEAEGAEIDPDELDVDEELFDLDDEDLDDLEFDDDDDDDDDDEEGEPDI